MTTTKSFLLLLFVISAPPCAAFVACPLIGEVKSFKSRSLILAAGSKNDYQGEDDSRKFSRISGNQRPPSPQDLEIMDQMIDKLADAKPYDLPTAVQRAFRVISSPQFFLRIANRVDQATSKEQRDKLQALASNLLSTLEAVVSTTTDRLEERSHQVQKIVAAAAEDDGEFLVPLSPDRRSSMRNAIMKLDPADLDQGFVATIDTWMNKSHQDGLDGMVKILQQVLQMYAGIVVLRTRKEQQQYGETSVASEIVNQMLETDAEEWESVLLDAKRDEHLDAVVAELQRTMETIVLGSEAAGSAIQQVQAEYLQEMAKRVEAVQKRSK
ncbi:hypothetical protein MPSEU_000573300 [Mayamaea pseudoterrestris]|nr:hypothetical protein MPSEU_000573300 [Mayamaea pseudoterrestris]